MPSVHVVQQGMAGDQTIIVVYNFMTVKKATGKTGETTLNDYSESIVRADNYKSQHLMRMDIFLNMFYHLLYCLRCHNYYLIS